MKVSDLVSVVYNNKKMLFFSLGIFRISFFNQDPQSQEVGVAHFHDDSGFSFYHTFREHAEGIGEGSDGFYRESPPFPQHIPSPGTIP